MKDPIVEEIRQFRDEYAEKFNYDLDKIYEDIKKQERQDELSGIKFVSFPPKQARRVAA